MSLESVIQIVSTAGGLIAAIYTARAAIQAKKSNQIAINEIKQNRRVKLNISHKDFKSTFSMDCGKDFIVDEDSIPIKKEKSKFYLKARNIGNLPAENVELSFEYEGIEDFVKSYSPENAYVNNGCKLFHTYKQDGKTHMEFYPDINRGDSFEFSSQKEFYGCVMPFDYSDSSLNIHLPLFYIYMINMKAIYEDISLFSLIIKLKFDDPNRKGESITQKFSLRPEIYIGDNYNYIPNNADYFNINGKFIVIEK
ncbi:hypothetical protein [Bacillus zhangzhouensis]|uniref:hypothetical protein n=1 Tax=Bacillus zhangzhouensis TaxID=1178540 RepID=UPI002E23E4B9|nr:hypothetical protein [Bacillus zhangzhouensis]